MSSKVFLLVVCFLVAATFEGESVGINVDIYQYRLKLNERTKHLLDEYQQQQQMAQEVTMVKKKPKTICIWRICLNTKNIRISNQQRVAYNPSDANAGLIHNSKPSSNLHKANSLRNDKAQIFDIYERLWL